MKVLFRLCFFVFLPIVIIVGLCLTITGVDARGLVLAIGIPSILVGYFIVWFIAPDKKTVANKNEQSEQNHSLMKNSKEAEHNEANTEDLTEKEQEFAALNDINSSKLYMSKIKMAEYEARHVTEAMKQASPKGIALGLIFFILLIVDVVLATVFVIKQIFVGAIVCAAIFGVTIIALLITALIREKISMNGNISKAKKIICGEVKTCFMSSVASNKNDYSVRVKSVVYRVVVSAEGVDYVTYSKQFYDTGDPVIIGVMSKKRAKIVSIEDLENKTGV